MEKKKYTIQKKEVTLYASDWEDVPLIVLNNFSGDGEEVMKSMAEIDTPECNLLVVGNLNWDHDMAPWSCPPIAPQDEPCTGGADAYLALLLSEIMPQTLPRIKGTPSWTGIAGYSLAGLFALYAFYQCETFDRVASMSGSLWFPDFVEYAKDHVLKKKPQKVYISLGDKEDRTKNPYLKTVRERTETLVKHYQEQGLDVQWELNPGNHFKNPSLRSAKGIRAILGE
ncbi:MAG: alpha/beta hydrolase [Lachnospiraceae bacterium]|nr:alpha/beta hydrolase [Lachnospiraceae bacterium]